MSIPPGSGSDRGAAVKIVLLPIFEADMLSCSYGFRPRCGAHDGLQATSCGASWAATVEAASTRCPPGRGGFRRPRRAGSTMLVVDIGGGTTDIASRCGLRTFTLRADGLRRAGPSRRRARDDVGCSAGPASARRHRRPGARCGRPRGAELRRWTAPADRSPNRSPSASTRGPRIESATSPQEPSPPQGGDGRSDATTIMPDRRSPLVSSMCHVLGVGRGFSPAPVPAWMGRKCRNAP